MTSSDSNVDPGLGIAVDLGTTTLAASLVDLSSGERMASAGALNPQREFGADVVSRLDAACRSGQALQRMAALVREELYRLAVRLLDSAGEARDRLRMVAVAGNPAMEHLLLGLPVVRLAYPPYRPLFSTSTNIPAADLGWDLSGRVALFPLPGGFVGGDTVAFLFGVPDVCAPCPGPRLFLDMGTNGEMVLQCGDVLLGTSAAAGPAFEGGGLACGMAALPGAVNGIVRDGDRVRVTTIGGGQPLGVCGSAVLDTVALLLEEGLLDSTGRLLPPEEIASPVGARMGTVGGEPAFILHRDAARTIYLSQEDIRQVQLAKGAIRAGMEVLCERARIRCEDIEEVVLTGSFGAVLSARSLKFIGIFTEKMVQTTRFVREGALAGVERALTAPEGFEAVDRLARALRVIPLSGTPAFEKHFLKHIDFPSR